MNVGKSPKKLHMRYRLSTRLYGLLLWLYPPALRRDHATEMVQAFRSTLRSEAERSGILGVVKTWFVMFTDLGLSSLGARWEARRRSQQRPEKRRGSHPTPDPTPERTPWRRSAVFSRELLSAAFHRAG